MNDSREISEREVKLSVSAAPESPMVSDIARDIEYGSTVVKIKAELEAALRQVEELKAKRFAETLELGQLREQVQILIGAVASLAHEKAKLSGIIEDARLAFGEINRRAQVLANTVDELRGMMNQ